MSNQAVDRQKLIEAILYVANRVDDPTMLRICKILYFADIEHLREYGRFVTEDNHVAMVNGPVPSGTYDIMKGARKFDLYIDAFSVKNNHHIVTHREADIDEFSESDLALLDRVIARIGNLKIGKLIKLSHDQAWDKATNFGQIFEDETSPNAVPLDLETIIEMMPNEDELRLHLTREGQL